MMRLVSLILFASVLLHGDTVLNCTLHSLDEGKGIALLPFNEQKHIEFLIKKEWYGKPTGIKELRDSKPQSKVEWIINTQSKVEWIQSEYMIFEHEFKSVFSGDRRIATIKISKSNPSKIIMSEQSREIKDLKHVVYGDCIKK